MSDLWFPGANLSRKAPTDGGSILGGKPKCVWHDTETNGLPSYSTGYFPNMTILGNTPYQHIPANRAARALKNVDGGVQTNRWNVFQIEICGWVNKIEFRAIYRDVAQWLKEARGCPLTESVDWIAYPGSAGASRVRMSAAKWTNYTGHCGHMHVPENVHGDPGWPFPIAQILAGEDDMYDAEAEKRLMNALEEWTRKGVRWTDHGDETVPGSGNHLEKVRQEMADFRTDVLNRLVAIENSIVAPAPPQGTPTTPGSYDGVPTLLALKLSPHEIAYYAKQAGFTGENLRIAVAVALAESSLDGGKSADTEALGRSATGASVGNRDHGLWQISGRWHGDKLEANPAWRSPDTNAKLAFKIFSDKGDWTPWATFNSKAHEKFLPDADIAIAHPFPLT